MKQNKVKRIISGVLAATMIFSSLTVSSATTANAATQVKLQEGTEYIIVSKKSNKALTVKDNSKDNNAKIVQMPVTESESQIWTLDADDKGYYQIVNKKSGKALDVPNSSKEQGKTIIQWNKSNGDNQKWKISHEGNGYYRIAPKISSKFGLNVNKNSTKDGAEIIQWTYSGNSNEQWEIREVDNSEEDVIRIDLEDLGGTRMNVPEASKGVIAGDISSSTSLYVTINCKKTGSYLMRIRYATEEDRVLGMIITPPWQAKSTYNTIDCPSTGGWTTLGTIDSSVSLHRGNNYITFTAPEGYAPNVDYVEIYGLNSVGDEMELQSEYEAEDGAKNATIMYEQNASGGEMVGDLGGPNAGKLELFDYYLANGKHTLRVFYAADEERSMKVTFQNTEYNGKAVTYTVKCPSTGGWTTVKSMDIVVDLPGSGDYYIDVEGVGTAYAPNIDYLQLYR